MKEITNNKQIEKIEVEGDSEIIRKSLERLKKRKNASTRNERN